MNENNNILENDWVDPDDALELTEVFFAEATPKINDEIVLANEVEVVFKKYIDDAEIIEILANTELMDDLKAGHEDIKAGRVTFIA